MSSVYLERENVVFIHNPKCAGSSIYRWFRDNKFCDDSRRDKHKPKSEFVKELKKKEDIFYKEKLRFNLELKSTQDVLYFTVTRNPFDKLVSWFEYFKMWDRVKHSDYLFKYYDFEDWFWECGKSRTESIFTKIDKEDCILRYERLEEDFKIIQNRLNCYRPLPKINISRNSLRKNNRPYQDYYINDSMIDAVYEWCKYDIDYFNYKFK